MGDGIACLDEDLSHLKAEECGRPGQGLAVFRRQKGEQGIGRQGLMHIRPIGDGCTVRPPETDLAETTCQDGVQAVAAWA